jgi:hypothetical protein
MNLIDAVVIEILSKPYEKYGKWWVDVLAQDDYAEKPSQNKILVNSKEEADAVCIGYKFLT